ncbi:MAG TPA: alkaline phosphatase family protein [Gemmatimonadales bacterium]|nr:alkaline phosphatase family protein [Gemmatimonadales bacterium]
MRRLVIVLADGLRPDAVTPTVMPSLNALGEAFTLARRAQTVRPSATVAALASLATGVGPATHRLIEPGLKFLPRLGAIRPVSQVLGRAGVPTDIVTADLGPAALPVAWALASTAGVRRLVGKGSRARETAALAHRMLAQAERRLLFVYLPDCDRAGHAHGWMSDPYLEAAAEVDAAVGLLSTWTDEAVVIVTADHGGGGVIANEHDEPHPINDHIPLIVAGTGVTRRHQLTREISILDVPATVLWWFGVPVPECYEGRPLTEAFAPVRGPAAPVPA